MLLLIWTMGTPTFVAFSQYEYVYPDPARLQRSLGRRGMVASWNAKLTFGIRSEAACSSYREFHPGTWQLGVLWCSMMKQITRGRPCAVVKYGRRVAEYG